MNFSTAQVKRAVYLAAVRERVLAETSDGGFHIFPKTTIDRRRYMPQSELFCVILVVGQMAVEHLAS